MHKDNATLVNYHDKVDNCFTHPRVDGVCVVVGPLAKVVEPDLVVHFLTSHQADIINHSRAYFGDLTRGFGGMEGWFFTLRYIFIIGDPSFSTCDTAWRKCAGLDEYELTSIPFPMRNCSSNTDSRVCE